MHVRATRIHPDITAARRLRRWHHGLTLLVALLLVLLLVLPALH